MTDDVPNQSPNQRIITLEEFQRFVVAKNVSTNCPACGNNSWMFVSDSDGKIPSVTAVSYPDTVSHKYLPTVINICNNCGFIRQFTCHTIELWTKMTQGEGENG